MQEGCGHVHQTLKLSFCLKFYLGHHSSGFEDIGEVEPRLARTRRQFTRNAGASGSFGKFSAKSFRFLL